MRTQATATATTPIKNWVHPPKSGYLNQVSCLYMMRVMDEVVRERGQHMLDLTAEHSTCFNEIKSECEERTQTALNADDIQWHITRGIEATFKITDDEFRRWARTHSFSDPKYLRAIIERIL